MFVVLKCTTQKKLNHKGQRIETYLSITCMGTLRPSNKIGNASSKEDLGLYL